MLFKLLVFVELFAPSLHTVGSLEGVPALPMCLNSA